MAAYTSPATIVVSDSRVTHEDNVNSFPTFISRPSWHRPNEKASNDSAKLSKLGLLRYLQEMPRVRGCRRIGLFLEGGGFYT
jgi:hypothetical protein